MWTACNTHGIQKLSCTHNLPVMRRGMDGRKHTSSVPQPEGNWMIRPACMGAGTTESHAGALLVYVCDRSRLRDALC